MLPEWLRIKPASTEKYSEIKQEISGLNLHTVCVEAHCPNITECWSGGTATFMVLGDLCTRGCRFCAVSKRAKGIEVDRMEPEKLARIVQKWGLDYIVITSVCRDDLPDQGASHFARCISEIKRLNPETIVEVLIPDFRNDMQCLKTIADAHPDVVGHNIETVQRLSPSIRDRRADYVQSLKVLASFKELDQGIYTKSAMMLGIGESDEEVMSALRDLRNSGVDFVAMGQYLRPTSHHLAVNEFVKPEKFKQFERAALAMGFLYAASGPFVRSSYRAGEYFVKSIIKKGNGVHAAGLPAEVPSV
ncbi:MAG: lipoyl synthase [Candidatus Micrarchaeota archaeon]|nr:lipoyl synthase [Candidatus Micrarchaeota archaeon]